jgi:hypothetical protein
MELVTGEVNGSNVPEFGELGWNLPRQLVAVHFEIPKAC